MVKNHSIVLIFLTLILLWTLDNGIIGVFCKKKSKYKIDNPELGPESNLDRSKRLREEIFEPSEFGIIKSDRLQIIESEYGSITQLPIRGHQSFDTSRIRSQSILSDQNNGIELIKPYEGVYVDYNLTSFSNFISRIVEMDLEMHLTFKEVTDRKLSIRRREREVLSHLNTQSNTKNSREQSHEKLNSIEFHNISFLFLAGYFKNENKSSGYGNSLQDFVLVFKDSITLSRQNANQYYAKYGITTFKDRLTAVMNSEESMSVKHKDLFSDGKINVDHHKLSFLYLPHNETRLYFSMDGTQRLILPKLHIKAIQTHQEADDKPELPSKDEDSNSKKVVIITFLIFTMFTSFIILFYIIITWYFRGIQKHS
ncbi:hypothetical protein [Cryptosporidium parvum Iowa II]|uniref:Uncharacterized protein n=2 Tax=Cryptosporidium parvum TaxID=5807 RepID=Q5CQS8_CRYPI|nr:hypothetical protein [Cryptosporidium parvum Iowa II]QOY42087.1 Uncharacterized protein CPATCC_0019100 [Cryptosporidium parvum]TRY52196.1 Uncharacterized protein CTYZ_00002114 [Cryptosporidium tyzzeri]WKS77391.1 hypothetical protein CPCDC_4g3480 [Cryptosporidium sp. 43IA8]EAK87778.1 hypothetical protein with signal peptide plus possible GPI anchor or transmembrane domain near C-terminus, within large locus of signal peptide containing proteins [Cryptosporidium parvum Iowa II]WRK31939.1 Unch|eukprot:QOY42087.1 hypothetical protein CPATCC_001690 [Cryptosporidium parvum]